MTTDDLNAINGQMASYQVTDQDIGTISYYGYKNRVGEYYLMRAVRSGATTAFRFFKPATGGDYATDWTARASKTYDYFDVIFK